jgi:CRISPR-associated exonuclease Cas4
MIPRVTGVMVQYYKVCKRELWLFAHQINYESDYIALGRLIHQESYSREKKNILIDDTISPDFLRKRKNTAVFEIKKSSKLEEPVRYQVLYYLWYLKQKGIDAEGEIVYPKERKREKVILSRDVEEEISQMLEDIEKVVKRSVPPDPIRKPYCKKCSYYEFCWC